MNHSETFKNSILIRKAFDTNYRVIEDDFGVSFYGKYVNIEFFLGIHRDWGVEISRPGVFEYYRFDYNSINNNLAVSILVKLGII